MSNQQSAEDFLFSTGARSAFPKDTDVGHKVSGTVVSAEIVQKTDVNGNLQSWEDGTPRMQLKIILQTDERDGEDDDGQRAVYANGGNYTPETGTGVSMKDAIAGAMKEAGISQLNEKCRLTIAHAGWAKPLKMGQNKARLYVAKAEVAAASTVSVDDLLG